MNLALAYSPFDQEAARRWLDHTSKWDQKRHDLFILPARGCPDLLPSTPENWKSVTVLRDELGVRSNWHTNEEKRDARGPNSMWRQFARYFHSKKLGPWFFCEPDCIPLYQGWLDDMESTHFAGGKPYTGTIEMRPWRHVTGNAIYPEHAAMEPLLILPTLNPERREIAFDTASARAVLGRCHFTDLIQHAFRAPPFTSRADFEARVRKDAAVFHSCKDGSIYQFLEPVDAPASAPVQAGDAIAINGSLIPAHPTLKKRRRRKSIKIVTRSPEEQAKINARMAKARAGRKNAQAVAA